ncbi:MAG: mandelate racemase/muconate lactonizing protein [Rhodococcus sp. (in: high G+C Gram-positive bacteria)]
MTDDPRLVAAQAKWEPIPPQRRRLWCRTLLEFPPIWYGTFPMIATRQQVLEGGYTNIGDWIDLAKRAEAVGFTPQTWLIFRQSLARDWLVEQFPAHPENQPKRRGNGGIEMTIVNPEDFAEWPWLYEAGYQAGEATTKTLTR